MDLSLLSKYKSELMGISILIIMIFHSYMRNSSEFILIEISHFMWIGVEFFLLLSGIGAFYSLNKNKDKIGFYKRRLSRILPTYILVALPFFVFGTLREEIQYSTFYLDLLLSDKTANNKK